MRTARPSGLDARARFVRWWTRLAPVLVALASPGFTPAADLVLSRELLDNLEGVVDFSRPTLGTGAQAIENTLGPGDTVYLEAHTRKRLTLKNLRRGTAADPVVVTNLGGQFVIAIAAEDDPEGEGIMLAGCQHVALRGTPRPGHYDYGIKVAATRHRKRGSRSGVTITDNGEPEGALYGPLDIEIAYLEIGHTGFAGIQAKCETVMPPDYVMDGLRIHHNYIHDTRGEGMYIGWTSPGHHDLANVAVHHNRLVNIGWDAIQLNTCVTNAHVHHNHVVGYGVRSHEAVAKVGTPNYWQNEAITGARNEIVIHDNWVQATGDGAGAAVFQYVYKDVRIYNNVLILTGSSGAPSFEAGISLADDPSGARNADATVKIMNNTIITPEGPGLRTSTTARIWYYNNIVAAPRHDAAFTEGRIDFLGSNLHVSSLDAAGFADVAQHRYDLTIDSPAVDAGTDLSGYGMGSARNEVPRPQGRAWDIGAYELHR